LGYSIFTEFIQATIDRINQPGALTWIGNHSIKAFVFNLAKDGYGLLSENSLLWIRQYSHTLEILLLGFVALCFVSILMNTIRRNERGLNVYLLMACTIGAMVIPAESNDYKLAILAGPMSILFCSLTYPTKNSQKAWFCLLAFLASFAYSCTLFPFKYRPEFLANSFPMLIVILITMTILYHVKANDPNSAADPAEKPA
jgi:predicted branched-subunit amino acid permease